MRDFDSEHIEALSAMCDYAVAALEFIRNRVHEDASAMKLSDQISRAKMLIEEIECNACL